MGPIVSWIVMRVGGCKGMIWGLYRNIGIVEKKKEATI